MAANPPLVPFPSDNPLTSVSDFKSPTFLLPIAPFPDNVIVSDPIKLLMVVKSDAAATVEES